MHNSPASGASQREMTLIQQQHTRLHTKLQGVEVLNNQPASAGLHLRLNSADLSVDILLRLHVINTKILDYIAVFVPASSFPGILSF